MDHKSNKTSSKKKLFIFIPIAIVVVAIIVFVCYRGFKSKEAFIFSEHLDDVAATINGEKLYYKDLSFYVLYEEEKVEKEAQIYNPESTKDWWNTYLNGEFVSVSARNTAMNMAMHDRIMYDLAKENNITLNEEEKAKLVNSQNDFWEDLLDEQKNNMPVSRDFINETIEQIALGEKYQGKLVAEKGVNYFEYNYDGYEYNNMIKNDYKIEIDDNYKKLEFGEITIHHDKVNYINGVNGPDEVKKDK